MPAAFCTLPLPLTPVQLSEFLLENLRDALS
jgi:hypothetical protein